MSLINVFWPVVDRRLHSFFASPKKERKERRPHCRCPFGVPDCAIQKNGKCPQLASLKQGHFLSIFCIAQSAAPERKGKNGYLSVRKKTNFLLTYYGNISADFEVEVDFAFAAWDAAICVLQKMDQKCSLFEPKASFEHFPFFAAHKLCWSVA